MSVTLGEALYNFLHARKTPANADLVERWSVAMETQLNVMPADGEPVAGRKSTWSNGSFTWHSARIPKNAATEPTWEDYRLGFPLDLYAEGIGMTGWRWRDRRSLWFGYDFDALTAHAKGIGVSDEALERVKVAACALPWVEVRRSTGGAGIHLYVYLDDGVPTETHTEHAALARCILGMMSAETGFDFASQIDACGHVMWVWHRKMTAENHGLEITKPATKRLGMADLPGNWRDHIEVVRGRRSKIRVNEIADADQDPFEALTSSRKIVPLDEAHKAQIEALMRSGFTVLWVADHHLLQAHTKALEELLNGSEGKDLKLVGIFKTLSEGRDPGTPNCFLFPLPHGAWKVYRFSPGVHEADTWAQDGEGWTTCYFNREPDLTTAARAHGGVEDPEKGGHVFSTTLPAREAVKALGADFEVPEKLVHRKTRLSAGKDGRLMVAIAREKDDADLPGWIDKSNRWVRGFSQRVVWEEEEVTSGETVRALLTPEGESAGLLIRQKDNKWVRQGLSQAKMCLQSTGMKKTEAEVEIGNALRDPHILVNQPFQPAWLPGRRCNIDAAQFKVVPEEGEHPHWDKVYDHTFAGLTEAIKKNPWFAENGIHSGGDYGRTWLACLIKDPFQPLPFLATVGEENSGKSIWYEATREYLFTRGVVNVNEALTRQDSFNGELEGALLCVVEEISLAGNRKALARLKEWTTARVLPIRRMRTDLYHVPCSAHFYMCCNQLDHIPVLAGDSRIIVCWVDKPAKPIPKKELLEKLEQEAPAMLHTLKNWRLPPIIDRLRLPLVETEDKADLAEQNSPTSVFLKECCFVKYGEHTSKDDARLIYDAWCKAQGVEPMKPGPLTTELKELTGGRVRPTKCRNGSTQYHAYKNLVITPEARQTYGIQA